MKRLLIFSIAALCWGQAPQPSPFAVGGAGGGGSGTVTEAIIAGTANEVAVSGTCTITTTGTCTIALATAIDLGGKTSLEIPNGSGPTTSVFGQIAGDNNAWAASRGAIQFYDGTANTFVIGALASDTPSNGQVPTWNTGGTITWETVSGSISGLTTNVIPKATSATTIGDSIVGDDGTTVTIGGDLAVDGEIATGDGTVAGELVSYELAANGTNFRSWLVPDALTADLTMTHANGVPTANQVMRFPAPTAGVAQYAWALPVWTDTTNTATSAFGLDMSAVTTANRLILPYNDAPTGDGALSYDSTNNNAMLGDGTNARIVPRADVAVGSITNDNCVKWAKSGSTVTLADTGAACGGAGASSYFPELNCIDNSTGWSDYGTALTITALTDSAAANCGVYTVITSAANTGAAQGRTTAASGTFSKRFAVTIKNLFGDNAEFGVMIRDSAGKAVTCHLRLASGSNRLIWVGDQMSSSTTAAGSETINSIWTIDSAQYVVRSGAIGAVTPYYTPNVFGYFLLASNGTTETCSWSFDGVSYLPIWSSTYLATVDGVGYSTRGNSAFGEIVVSGVD